MVAANIAATIFVAVAFFGVGFGVPWREVVGHGAECGEAGASLVRFAPVIVDLRAIEQFRRGKARRSCRRRTRMK